MIRYPSRSDSTFAVSARSDQQAPGRAPTAALLTIGVALAVSVGCSSKHEPIRFASVSTLPSDAPRRPAGVAVDPSPTLPKPLPSASAEQGLIVLKAPLDAQAARQVVKEFFRAAVDQDGERLEALLDEGAHLQAGASMGRQQAQPFWRLRLSRLDYGALGGQVLFRDAEIEIYRSEELQRLRPARALGLSAQGDDVLVRVVISAPRVGRTRLFGDEITFLLRPSGSSYKIVEMAEDFQLP
jgi:hypothetical protein